MAHQELQMLSYSDLPEWNDDNHIEAFQCFLLSAEKFQHGNKPPKAKKTGIDGGALSQIFLQALEYADRITSNAHAREFFEAQFIPAEFHTPSQASEEWPGLLTAYYEPVLQGSRLKTAEFPVPLLRRPPDLFEIKPETDKSVLPDDWPHDLRFGRSFGDKIVPYFDRAEIEGQSYADGALANKGLELIWLKDRLEAFFIHIQGSACINLADETVMRVSYDGKSGHDYTPIGRVLKERGVLTSGSITMASIKEWLRANPSEQLGVLHANRSFIFFREEIGLQTGLGPRAAAGVQLSKGRSLAVDRLMHTFHAPIYVSSKQDDRVNHRLMIAQDTGSAIVGAHRGDYFSGSGNDAGVHAGGFAASARFRLLVPKLQLEPQQ